MVPLRWSAPDGLLPSDGATIGRAVGLLLEYHL